MECRPALQVDTLPDTPDRPVPALLAVRDLGEGVFGEELLVTARVDDPDHQLVRRLLQDVGDVDLEGEVSAFVAAHLPSVEPDGGRVVHRAEMQEVPGGAVALSAARLAGLSGNRVEAEPIPCHAGVVAEIVELRLPGAGNPDRAGLLLRTQAVGTESSLGVRVELPLSV